MLEMKYKGFTAKVMEAERLIGEHTFGLPPGTPLPVYYVDEFLHPKDEWMTGPGSFVVPVRPEKGLWFDWRGNSEINTAVVPTIKGCNPITGLKTEGFFLESFADKCPKHKCDFMADRYCPKCDFKWPDRNYQSMHPLWWDGFRADGYVRQFFFSEDELRDVASSLIGKKNTVPAYGFAFFTPKEMRPEVQETSRGVSNIMFKNTLLPESFDLLGKELGVNYEWGNSGGITKSFNYSTSYIASKGLSHTTLSSDSAFYHCNTNEAVNNSAEEKPPAQKTLYTVQSEDVALEKRRKAIKNIKKRGGLKKVSSFVEDTLRCSDAPKKNVEVSIGAGAKIKQDLNRDTYPLDSWKEKPDAVMTLYFVFQDEFEKIKAQGMRDLTGKKEGMLSNTPVG
jgi:hypothetical protein